MKFLTERSRVQIPSPQLLKYQQFKNKILKQVNTYFVSAWLFGRLASFGRLDKCDGAVAIDWHTWDERDAHNQVTS